MRIYAPLNSESIPILQEIEAASFFQLPAFQIIGLPGPEVAEARERIRAAMEASGYEFPKRKVVLNLSPASVRKRGTGLDLAMALSVLAMKKEFPDLSVGAWGELALDGSVKESGQMTRAIYAAWKGRLSFLFLPESEYTRALEAREQIRESGEFAHEAPQLVAVKTLKEAWKLLVKRPPPDGNGWVSSDSGDVKSKSEPHEASQLMPISQAFERMMGSSAAGHHHLLILGPRGTGKSQATEWLIALRGQISPQDRLKLRLVSELGSSPSPERLSPARRVSSQVRPGALIGHASATAIRPGEFSLAHGGMLIADELPEWARDSRESLREPLERGKVTLTRAHGALELPARFLFVANGNLCPCGGWPPQIPYPKDVREEDKRLFRCECTEVSRRGYFAKLSGPILDRIDMVVMTCVPKPEESSQDVTRQFDRLQAKVLGVRESLRKNWGKPSGSLSGAETEALIQSHPDWAVTLANHSVVSLRSRHKVVRLALTLAAWDGKVMPNRAHFSEAFWYRVEKLI